LSTQRGERSLLSSRPLRWDILEEQLEEADFLWCQWEAALRAPDYTLAEVRELEERLEAHLDGLQLGRTPVAERLLLPVLTESEAEVSRVSAASYVLLAQDGSALEQLRVLMEEGSPTQRAGIRRALELCDWDDLELRLLPWLKAQPSPVHSAALEVLLFRHYVLPGGVQPEWVDSEEPSVAAAALRALSLAPSSLGRKVLERALGSNQPEVYEAALETGAVLGSRAAWRVCRQRLAEGAPSRLALLLLAMGGGEAGLEVLKKRLTIPAQRAEVLWALGFSGQVAAADLCVELLGEQNILVAKLAAEAFCAITGLELEGEYAREERSEELPLEEELEQDLSPKPEDALKCAEPRVVERWWKQARNNFDRRWRYLRGQRWSALRLIEALGQEPMRRRSVLAMELTIRTKGQHRLQASTWTWRQFQQLGTLKGLHEESFSQSFDSLLRWD
jgi:uncharacterized protein (TIGR02270 family)